MWSSAGYAEAELRQFAHQQQLPETRYGVQIMALLAILVQMSIAGYLLFTGSGAITIATNVLLGVLALHVMISAVFVNSTRALHLLGMALLIISALAVTVLAHRMRELNVAMMAAIVLIFVAVPLVPWALREVAIVIGLTYGLLTVSLMSVPDRFDSDSLMILQMLIVGAATVAAFVSGRSALVRKHELRARYELEAAHREMERFSMQDHLTGAWNRRYVEDNFTEILKTCNRNGEPLQLAVLDIDDFKGVNDQFGHHAGDQVLVELVDAFIKRLADAGNLVRMGGDEFLILYCGDDLRGLIDRATADVQKSSIALGVGVDRGITLSAGIVSTQNARNTEFGAMYKAADQALYEAKTSRVQQGLGASGGRSLAMSGRWKL